MKSPDGSKGYAIKTERQPDNQWKAWVVGTSHVCYGETEAKAALKAWALVSNKLGEHVAKMPSSLG